MPERVSFLLGSGVSIPAGMPSVKDITKESSQGWRSTATRMESITLGRLMISWRVMSRESSNF